jgi:hypothetical protein
MGAPSMRIVALLLFPALSVFALNGGGAQPPQDSVSPVVPRTWDAQALASVELPLASTGMPPEHISADYHDRMRVRPIYRSYPIYAPGKEARGYFERLTRLEPEIVFDPAKLRTEADWIKAGELVFDAPGGYSDPGIFVKLADVRNPAWYQKVGVLLAKDGVMPYARYVSERRERSKSAPSHVGCATRA